MVLLGNLWGRKPSINPDAISLGQFDTCGNWSWNGPEARDQATDLAALGCP